MCNYSTDKKPIAPLVSALGVGESIDFPVARAEVVRSTITTRQHQWGMGFACHTDQEKGIITVTRIK